jgi:hypothetical protein
MSCRSARRPPSRPGLAASPSLPNMKQQLCTGRCDLLNASSFNRNLSVTLIFRCAATWRMVPLSHQSGSAAVTPSTPRIPERPQAPSPTVSLHGVLATQKCQRRFRNLFLQQLVACLRRGIQTQSCDGSLSARVPKHKHSVASMPCSPRRCRSPNQPADLSTGAKATLNTIGLTGSLSRAEFIPNRRDRVRC